METKTNYRSNYKSTLSPFHKKMQDKVFDYSNPKNPVREEINKNIGNFSLNITIEEDKETLSLLKTPGLISFLCLLKIGQKVVGTGRGTSCLDQNNRYIERSVRYAFNAAILDAVAKTVKTSNVLYPNKKEANDLVKEIYKAKKAEPITDKQRKYLTQLIHSNIMDDEVKRGWEDNLESFSLEEAHNAIKSFSG